MKYCYYGCVLACIPSAFCTAEMVVPEHEVAIISMQVWRNEDARRKRNLLTWNKGEEGASLGIAHFTWYPKKNSRKTTGTFPELVDFLQKQGSPLPQECGAVNLKNFYAPWNNREEFLTQQRSPLAQSLRRYMLNTIALQMKFVVQRLDHALPLLKKIVKNPTLQMHIEEQFSRLAATLPGRYALVDYTNLAGEGGLLKVLQRLQGSDTVSAVDEFVKTAQAIMAARVASKKGKDQARWLKGWNNRLNTYLTFNQ